MLILDLTILGTAAIALLYAKQMLDQAVKLNDDAVKVAARHNEQLFLLKQRMIGLQQLTERAIELAKRPCEKCGHVTKVPLP